MERDKYGIYKLSDIGPILAEIASYIEDKNYNYQIIKCNKLFQYGLDKYEYDYIWYEQAIINLGEEVGYKYIFKESATSYKPGHKKTTTKLNEYENLAFYIDNKFTTLNKNLPDYLSDFITKVSLYRLEFDINELTLEKLTELKNDYLNMEHIKKLHDKNHKENLEYERRKKNYMSIEEEINLYTRKRENSTIWNWK